MLNFYALLPECRGFLTIFFLGVEGSACIRDLLGLPQHEVIVLEPINYPQYEVS